MDASKKRGNPLKLSGPTDLIPFFSHYDLLLKALMKMEGKKHDQVIQAYKSELSVTFKKEFGDFIENLKVNRLVRGKAEEKPFCIFNVTSLVY